MAAFQALDASCWRFAVAGEVLCEWCWVDGTADGVDTVKCSGEDQIVIAVELLQTGCEGAVVNQPAGFVDDEEREDDPIACFVSRCETVQSALLCTYISGIGILRQGEEWAFDVSESKGGGSRIGQISGNS